MLHLARLLVLAGILLIAGGAVLQDAEAAGTCTCDNVCRERIGFLVDQNGVWVCRQANLRTCEFCVRTNDRCCPKDGDPTGDCVFALVRNDSGKKNKVPLTFRQGAGVTCGDVCNNCVVGNLNACEADVTLSGMVLDPTPSSFFIKRCGTDEVIIQT
jgi:hypothetical protein